MQSFDFKKILPHLLIVLGFLVLAFIYCYPALEGKVLSQGDVSSWKGMSEEARAWHEKTGENTLWTNSMFGGMPTYTFYVPESHNYMGDIYQKLTKLVAKPVNFFFLAMLGFYILMSTLRVNRWLGAIGAVAFAFASFNVVSIVAGHDTKLYAMMFMPIALAGMIMVYRNQYLTGAVVMALGLSLTLSSAHYQIIFYLLMVMVLAGITFLVDAIKKGTIKNFLIATLVSLLAGALAVAPAAGSLLSTREYVKQTMRGGQSELTFNHDQGKKSGGLDRDYAFQWSNGVGETFCIMIPYLYGGSSDEPLEKGPKAGEIMSNAGYQMVPLYWGDQPFLSGPVYFGAIICFLFVLGLMVVRNNNKWWILAASILSIFMSLGRNFPAFNNFLFDHLPLYNTFRTPTMALAIAQLMFPMLGIWGLMEIIKTDANKEELWKKTRIALGITAGLCVLIGLAGGMFFEYSGPSDKNFPPELVKALKEDRASLAMKSAFQSALFILLAGAVIWAYLKNKIKPNILIIGMGVLIALDMIPVAANYLGEKNYTEDNETAAFQPRPVDQQILQDKDPYYRVLDVTRNVFNDATQCYFHKCIGGYSPAKLELYQDLIDVHMSKGFTKPVLDMLNTKYIIFNGPQNQPVAQPNPDAMGNAWFVNEVKWAKTADEEILDMKGPVLGDTAAATGSFDPRRTAIMRETFQKDLNGFAFGKDSTAKITLTKYGLNDLNFAAHNSQAGLAVFSDIYYPYGWKAFVDGNEVPILKANYLLRAIKVPAGDHKIEFRFHPDTFYKGDKISMIGSITLIILMLVALGMVFKGKKETQPQA